MGIDLIWEDELGRRLEEVPDPRGYFMWLLTHCNPESTICLRFIDPYGNTVFNQQQIPIFIHEIQEAQKWVTDKRMDEFRRREIDAARAAKWQESVIQEMENPLHQKSAAEVLLHIDRILDLARRSMGQVHTYLKFYGD